MAEPNVAVLLDYENVGLDSIQYLLDQLSDVGRLIIKRAYADWSVERNKRDQLLEMGIEAIHHFRSTRSGKNSSDICLAIDAVTPNFMIQEMFTPWDVDWRDTVVIGSLRVVDGYIEVPDRPGLGVELVHDELAKHPFEAKDLQIFSREA